jgi:hypothetical protein
MKHFLTSFALILLRIIKTTLIYCSILLAIPFFIVVLGCLMPFASLFIAWSSLDKAEQSIQKRVKILIIQM